MTVLIIKPSCGNGVRGMLEVKKNGKRIRYLAFASNTIATKHLE